MYKIFRSYRGVIIYDLDLGNRISDMIPKPEGTIGKKGMLDFIKIKNLHASKTSSIKWGKKPPKKRERKIICLLRV